MTSNALKKGLKKYLKDRKAGKIQSLTPIEKAEKNPKSLRLAINAKCWDCVCGQRLEIKLCPMETNCSLWPVRPYQEKI